MSESKSHQFRPPQYSGDASGSLATGRDAVAPHRPAGDDSNKGWDAYRKWLSSVGAPRDTAVRTPIDRSVYSWKGYHSWADRVKQSWNPDDS